MPEGAEAVPVGAPDENNVQEGYVEKPGVLVKQADGLPNITATVGIQQGNRNIYATGAFFFNNNMTGTDKGYSEELYQGLSFDAHRSNPIYGASAHVTPENYTYRIWRRTA